LVVIQDIRTEEQTFECCVSVKKESVARGIVENPRRRSMYRSVEIKQIGLEWNTIGISVHESGSLYAA